MVHQLISGTVTAKTDAIGVYGSEMKLKSCKYRYKRAYSKYRNC